VRPTSQADFSRGLSSKGFTVKLEINSESGCNFLKN